VCNRFVRISFRTNLAILVGIVGAATLISSQLNGSIVPNLATGAAVKTSSVMPGTPAPSSFVDGDIYRVGFNTMSESRPWVEVDLGRDEQVRRLVLYNRVDCCRERGMPFVVKFGHDGHTWVEVAQIRQDFEIWDKELTPQPVRFIRIESESTDFFSLNEIEVR